MGTPKTGFVVWLVKSSTHVINVLQRTRLEDDFDDLMKGASSDIQDSYKSELERQDLADSGLDVEDEKLILDDYNSDDDKNTSDDDDEEDVSTEHCTKVENSVFFISAHSEILGFSYIYKHTVVTNSTNSIMHDVSHACNMLTKPKGGNQYSIINFDK